MGPVTPLVARGSAPILSWSPQQIMPASEDTMARLLDLYRHNDVKLASVLEDNSKLTAIEHAGDMAKKRREPGPAQVRAYFSEAAGNAAKFLAQPDGPRVGALALDGWDTHVNEGIASGRLSQLLGSLDDALGAIKTNMGPAWKDTVVVLATEFGRTAHINGTDGTDHGTATVSLLVGGALKGGRVIADWPGLKSRQSLREPRPQADHRSARGDQGRAEGSPARRRACAGAERVSRQRRRQADGGPGRLENVALACPTHSPAFRLFHSAILKRQQVTLTYKGQYREVCPYILGHKNGKETVLVFQFAGSSTDCGPVSGEWRCFYLSQVEGPQTRDGAWYGDAAHRTTQSCVGVVYIDVNTDVPNQPGRRFRIVEMSGAQAHPSHSPRWI